MDRCASPSREHQRQIRSHGTVREICVPIGHDPHGHPDGPQPLQALQDILVEMRGYVAPSAQKHLREQPPPATASGRRKYGIKAIETNFHRLVHAIFFRVHSRQVPERQLAQGGEVVREQRVLLARSVCNKGTQSVRVMQRPVGY